jgi:hypothetical protein
MKCLGTADPFRYFLRSLEIPYSYDITISMAIVSFALSKPPIISRFVFSLMLGHHAHPMVVSIPRHHPTHPRQPRHLHPKRYRNSVLG